jgi:hypothetical protein
MDLEEPVRRDRGGMRFRLLSLGVVVAVLAAGCGGSSTPTTTTKKQPSHKASATQMKTTTSSTASSGGASTSSTSASSSTPTFASAGNCSSLAGVGDQFAKAMSSASSGGKFNLSEVVTAYKNLANSAPSAIRPDIEVLANAFSSYASALSKVGYKFGSVPSASQVSAIEGAVKVFDASKLQAATKNLEAWAASHCK